MSTRNRPAPCAVNSRGRQRDANFFDAKGIIITALAVGLVISFIYNFNLMSASIGGFDDEEQKETTLNISFAQNFTVEI